MSEKIVQIADANNLQDKLAEVLQSWPLYRTFEYQGSGLHIGAPSLRGGTATYAALPPTISLYCADPKCANFQRWTTNDTNIYLSDDRYNIAEYRCRNCGSESVTYFFRWWEKPNGNGVFCKVGQYPPLDHMPPKELEKRLDKEDLDFYKKALTCRNFSYGLAALSYLRRVVENRTNDLLDLLFDVAKTDGADSELLKDIEGVKTSRVFEDKLTYASRILPSRLKPGGHDPIGSLHDLSSRGIHRESEEECLDIFDHAKNAFEYLFMQLDHDSETSRAYLESMKKLNEKRSQKQ